MGILKDGKAAFGGSTIGDRFCLYVSLREIQTVFVKVHVLINFLVVAENVDTMSSFNFPVN